MKNILISRQWKKLLVLNLLAIVLSIAVPAGAWVFGACTCRSADQNKAGWSFQSMCDGAIEVADNSIVIIPPAQLPGPPNSHQLSKKAGATHDGRQERTCYLIVAPGREI
jgi:hypothetical protein